MAYRRRVTSGEKSMVALNELRPPFAIQLVIEGEGVLEPDALFDALEAAAAVNPGASLRLLEGRPDDFWVTGESASLTVVDDAAFTARGTDPAPFLRWALDAVTGPTCELVLVRSPAHHRLVFRVLHAVMDGQGCLLWVKDVMRCLRGESPIGHPSTVDVQALCDAERDDRRPLPAADALHPLGLADDDASGGHAWRRVTIDRPMSNTTAGQIAVALAELAAESHGQPGIVRIHVPNDLRMYCPDERSTANLFGSLFIEVEPGMTAPSVGARVVQMLSRREGKRPAGLYSGHEAGSMAAHRVKAFVDFTHIHATGRYATSATLSHLGRLDSASLSGPDWRATSAFFVPLVGDSCVVSLNGFEDHIEVAVGVGGPFLCPGVVDRLADHLRKALDQASG